MISLLVDVCMLILAGQPPSCRHSPAVLKPDLCTELLPTSRQLPISGPLHSSESQMSLWAPKQKWLKDLHRRFSLMVDNKIWRLFREGKCICTRLIPDLEGQQTPREKKNFLEMASPEQKVNFHLCEALHFQHPPWKCLFLSLWSKLS